MQSVSSNAVAKSLSYSTTEQKTGGKSTDGKDIYKMTITYTLASAEQGRTIPIPNFEKEIRVYGTLYVPSYKAYFPIPYCYYDRSGEFYEVYTYIQYRNITIIPYSRGGTYFGAGSVVEVTIEYTKITD